METRGSNENKSHGNADEFVSNKLVILGDVAVGKSSIAQR